MKTAEITINSTNVKGYEIELQHSKLILVVAPKGYVMCGYLNIEAADKFSDLAAIVKGVNSIDELLLKEVFSVSKQGLAAGIRPGMTGKEALSHLI